MKKNEAHKQYWIGQNLQFFPNQRTILKMSFPRVFIRFTVEHHSVAKYEDFKRSISEVEWMDGEKPTADDLERVFSEAWEFVNLEDYIVEKGIDAFDD